MGFLKIPSDLEGMSDYCDRDGFWMARKFWQEIYQKTWWDFQKSRQDFSGQFFLARKTRQDFSGQFFLARKTRHSLLPNYFGSENPSHILIDIPGNVHF